MGQKVTFRVRNHFMIQFKENFLHCDKDGKYYYDGTRNQEQHPGIEVDFQIEHSYEIFKLLDSAWGNWNDTPTADVMYQVAKSWYENYRAEVIEIDYDSVAFSLDKELSREQVLNLLEEVRRLQGAIPRYDNGYQDMEKDIRANKRFEIWWD